MIFYNRGISGNKVNDLAKRWQADTLDLKPDVLSILVGINDAASVVFQREPVITVEKYEELYQSLLDQTLLKFPNVLFVLCEPFILKVGKVKDNWDSFTADIEKRQAIVRKLSLKYNAVYVGFQDVFNKACEKAPADYWMWDGVHPTVPGHELMAREWMKQVDKKNEILVKFYFFTKEESLEFHPKVKLRQQYTFLILSCLVQIWESDLAHLIVSSKSFLAVTSSVSFFHNDVLGR